MAFAGDENASCARALLEQKGKRVTMQRHLKQIQSAEERLAAEAKRLHEEAELLPPGAVREAALRKARQAETASHVNEWLASPGLKPPV